jgi:ATPase family AAA domain-containing protein 3A/B
MIYLLFLCLFLPINQLSAATADPASAFQQHANNIFDSLENVHLILETRTEEAIREYKKEISSNEQRLVQLASLRDSNKIGKNAFDTEKALLEQRLATAREGLHQIEAENKASIETANKILTSGFNAFIEIHKGKELADLQVRQAAGAAAAQQAVANVGSMERLQYLTNADVLQRIVVYSGLGALGVSTAVYGSQLGIRYLQRKIEKIPDLVRETSRTNIMQRAKKALASWWAGPQPIAKISEHFVFAPDILTKLTPIAERTGQLRARGLPFPGLFLDGPPGTGKTAFAKWLAYNTGMEYAIVSGSEIVKHPEGLSALIELIEWSQECENGMILFIDEVDAIAFNRNKNPDRNVVILLEELLVLMSDEKVQRACKFIGATNYKDNVDSAFLSRCADQITIGLPGETERMDLLKLYLNKYIINQSHPIKENGVMRLVKFTCAPDVTDAIIKAAAIRLIGASGRTISQLVRQMQTEVLFSNDFVLSAAMFQQVVENHAQ